MAEFAEIWRPLEKIVFSTTLTSVEGSNRLATGTLEEEIAALGNRKIAVGGSRGQPCDAPHNRDEKEEKR